ncbi:MAG: hypothetical protein DRJ42_13445 [Deltaproteobacteria bacterium]|nr:MAG: hypothetical protein DRJ42_13445 [Deltaproteobacteria bacterium]
MDTKSLENTYRRFFPIIAAKCARMLRDPAEAQDLAQETFTRLWAMRGTLRDDDKALGWVYQTATRLAVDRIRHRNVAGAALVFDVEESDNPSERAEARQLLKRLSMDLEARELEALVLSRIDGLTHAQIGTVLGTSDRTVRRLLERADQAAKKALGAP